MSNVQHDPWVDLDFEQKVRETAYFLWEQGGRKSGREKEYWFIALDRCLREREADELLKESPETFFNTRTRLFSGNWFGARLGQEADEPSRNGRPKPEG